MKNWVPDKHCREMVYRQYYYPYIYDRDPYFESKMTSCYDEKYDPEEYKLLHPNSIELHDGTIIEHFGSNNWLFFFILIIILIIFFIK